MYCEVSSPGKECVQVLWTARSCYPSQRLSSFFLQWYLYDCYREFQKNRQPIRWLVDKSFSVVLSCKELDLIATHNMVILTFPCSSLVCFVLAWCYVCLVLLMVSFNFNNVWSYTEKGNNSEKVTVIGAIRMILRCHGLGRSKIRPWIVSKILKDAFQRALA